MRAAPKLDGEHVPRAAGRPRGPFGLVTQSELVYLREIGADPGHIALLVVLRARVDGSTGTVADTLSTLGKWSRISGGALKRRLYWLQAHGIVKVEERAGVEGSRGQWSRRRRPRPFEEWPNIGPRQGQSSSRTLVPQRTDVDVSIGPRGRNNGPARTNNGPGPRGVVQNVPESPESSANENDDELTCDALEGVRSIENYPFDESRDRAMLVGVRRRRPGVQLLDEIETWVERGRTPEIRDQRAALEGWLLIARDALPRKRDPRCAVRGCRGRGRGSRQLCVEHLGLGPAQETA